jgi:hypothetical protein
VSKADTKAPLDLSEERHRLLAMAAGVPLVLLASPLVLPFGGDHPLLYEARRDPPVIAVLLGLAFLPIFVGIAGIVRGRKREAPGRFLFGVPGVVCTLMALGLTGMMLLVLLSDSYVRRENLGWITLAMSAAALAVLARGFFRTGWRRFNHVIAGIWLLSAISVVLGFASSSPVFDPPVLGEWVFLFAIATLSPLLAYAFFSRGKSEQGPGASASRIAALRK